MMARPGYGSINEIFCQPHLEAVHVGSVRLDCLDHEIQRTHLLLDGLHDGHPRDVALGLQTDRAAVNSSFVP